MGSIPKREGLAIHSGSDAKPTVFVAIDIAKAANDVVVEFPNGKRKCFRVANCLDDFKKFRHYLSRLSERVVIGYEATGNYHRLLFFSLSRALNCFSFPPSPLQEPGKPFIILGTKMTQRMFR